MKVENISNHNFGTLKYNPKARKVIARLIKDDIVLGNRAIIEHLSLNYKPTHVNGLQIFENFVKTKRIKSEKRINGILNKFKEALEFAQQSKTQNVNITYRKQSKKLPESIIVTINDEQFAHRKYTSMLNFINKISNKILGK